MKVHLLNSTFKKVSCQSCMNVTLIYVFLKWLCSLYYLFILFIEMRDMESATREHTQRVFQETDKLRKQLVQKESYVQSVEKHRTPNGGWPSLYSHRRLGLQCVQGQWANRPNVGCMLQSHSNTKEIQTTKWICCSNWHGKKKTGGRAEKGMDASPYVFTFQKVSE